MKSVAVILFALIAFAAAQNATYVRISTYAPNDNACVDGALMTETYVIVGECVVVMGGAGSVLVNVNATSGLITQWMCANTNCSQEACEEFVLAADQCYAQMDSNNNTFAYESYATDVDTAADFAAVPVDSILAVTYPSGNQCNVDFDYAIISYSGNLCAPGAGAHVNLQCSGGCLSVQTACQVNETTDMCYGCPSGPSAVPTGCVAAFNSYISCGPYGAQTCNSTATTTTSTGSLTSGGASTTTSGAASTTTSGATSAGTTTGRGTTTGAGTTGSSAAVTTGSASSIVLSGFAAVAAAVALFL